MFNSKDILETIKMIQEENLDIRTITMGISLLDCIDSDIDKSCEKVYVPSTVGISNFRNNFGISILPKSILSFIRNLLFIGLVRPGDGGFDLLSLGAGQFSLFR